MFIADHTFSNIKNKDLKNNIGISNLMKTLYSTILLNNSNIENILISNNLYDFIKTFFNKFNDKNFINNSLRHISELEIYNNYKNNKELLYVQGWRLFNKWKCNYYKT